MADPAIALAAPAIDRRAWLRAVDATNVSPGARLIAGYMARLPSFPDAFFSLRQLTEVTGRGIVQNRRYVRELESATVIGRAPHVDPRYGQRSNDYTASIPGGMIGGAIAEDRAFLRRSRVLNGRTLPPGPQSTALTPTRDRDRAPGALTTVAPPVAPPPALLAAVLREHGIAAEGVVASVLGTREARDNPAAAVQALEALTTFGRADVRTTLGRLFMWLVREAIAGRDQRNVVTGGPAANTPIARVQRAIDDAVQTGRLDEAHRLKEAAFRAGRAAARRVDELELQDPGHARAQALIDAARAGIIPALPAPPPRPGPRGGAGFLHYLADRGLLPADKVALPALPASTRCGAKPGP